MEDVFLHFRNTSEVQTSASLPSLLRTAQNLLEPFPCRIAPVFTPWYPPACHRPPLTPARLPPIITFPSKGAEPEGKLVITPTGEGAEPVGVSGPKRAETALPDPPVRRNWIVAAQGRVPSHSERCMSKSLQDTLLIHKLHPLQRAHWVIQKENCGTRTNLEQVWRALCRTIRTASLPSCTATIQRDRAEVWVFCDLEWAEHVGGHLKGALQLQGSIRLCVRSIPNILSI
ncbi:unnamed protein product [Ophioblennius macclurei]